LHLLKAFLVSLLLSSVAFSVSVSGQAFKKVPLSKNESCKSAISQGVTGKVLYYTGNMMPDPSQPRLDKGKPVSRYLYFYERCKGTAGDPYREFFREVDSKFIKKVSSDGNGCFKANLKPGWYTLLIEEENKLYTNIFDQNGYINPVEVKKGKLTSITLRITHSAYF